MARSKSRESYIPSGYVEHIRDAELGVLVMLGGSGTCVAAFAGKAVKPQIYKRFGSAERALAVVSQWLQEVRATAAAKAEQAAQEKAKPNPYTLGDLLRTSWGCEQTNVNFYQVVELKGAKTVVVRELDKEVKPVLNQMSGVCFPIPDKFIGEALTRRVNRFDALVIAPGQWARAVPLVEIGGRLVPKESAYTSYA